MRYAEGTEIEFTTELMYSEGTPVQVIRFAKEMSVLSSAIYNGGDTVTDCILIMQVPKDYMPDDPHGDVDRVVTTLKLPKSTVGLMTAAEVEYVFNVTHHDYKDHIAYAAVTAGLSNQVVAGDDFGTDELLDEVCVDASRRFDGGAVFPHQPGADFLFAGGQKDHLAGEIHQHSNELFAAG